MRRLTELAGQIGTKFPTVTHVEETGSTNADLLAAAADGAPDGLVLVADHQTAGRGRQDRTWHDEPGCALLVSILLRPHASVAPLMPLLAGVAAVDAVAELDRGSTPEADASAEPAPVGLKWPNDVLAPGLGERKVAGILAESSTVWPKGSAESVTVVVGMGMNLRFGTPPPPEIEARAATVAELVGRDVDRATVLAAYLASFDRRLTDLEAGGPSGLLAAYRSRCLTIGRRVRFVTGKATHDGTVVDVSDDGTLLLDTGAEVIELHAGDAHHVPFTAG